MHAQNDDYSVVRNYKMIYILYNEGWLLEKVENYDNTDAPTSTRPLRGVSYKQFREDVSEMEFMKYSSFANGDYNIVSSFSLDDNFYFEFRYTTGRCHVGEILVQYIYPGFFEMAYIPIEYYFAQQEDGSYGWNYEIKYKEIKREVELHQGFIGKYLGDFTWDEEIEIVSVDKNSAYIRYSKDGFRSEYWERVCELTWSVSEENGKIYYPRLEVDEWTTVGLTATDFLDFDQGSFGRRFYREQ